MKIKYTIAGLMALAIFTPSIAKAGNPSFEVYGFAQLDYIQDFNRVNPAWDATLRPSRIPTTDGIYGSDGQAILSVRQSRLGVKANLPTDAGDVYTKFEFDLYGVGVDEGQTTIRLRHAYGQFGNILAGQTNSLFMDGDIFPNTIDYWGPTGMVFFRTVQLRYTHATENRSFSVAIENPGNDIDTGQIRTFDPALAGAIKGDEKVPDLTANVRTNLGGGGHVQLAGILRRIGYDSHGTPNNEPKGSETGWGLDLTSVLKVRQNDALKVGVVYGAGIASYMNDGGMDLAPAGSTTTSVSAEAVPLLGVMLYYDIAWNAKWSSSIGASLTQVDNTDFQAPDAYKSGHYASVNLLYYPTKNVFYGAEYLYGRREDNNGYSGEDSRIQLSAHFKFSSRDFIAN